MKGLSSFLQANKKLSRRLTPEHVHEANVFGVYRKIGTIILSHPKVSRVADIGAGKAWQFPAYYKEWYGIDLVGIDIDGNEMADNTTLNERIVCDAVIGIPLDEESIDCVMVHSAIEHFQDNERFLQNAFRVLRPGGFLLAQFPGRYAPFAIANRLLPEWLAKRLLRASMGDTNELGFKTYYDRTNYRSFSKLSANIGFEQVCHVPGYFSSSYCEFLTALYVLSYLYDTLSYGLGIREIASYHLFLLRKPSDKPDPEPLRLHAWK